LKLSSATWTIKVLIYFSCSYFNSDGKIEFLRVVSGKKLGGQWIMRQSDIKGLTPQQIADKFALENVPTGSGLYFLGNCEFAQSAELFLPFAISLSSFLSALASLMPFTILPAVPAGTITDNILIKPPKGVKIRTGKVNENFDRPGGGTQFQLLDEIKGWSNVTPF
jgi:filamentous hemagglutinin